MEACATAHFWARKLMSLGHTVKLIAPQFVKPYVRTNKDDARDAEAICEAVSRPSMRFVPTKTVEQQAVIALHRVRQGFVEARTAQANQLRSLLAEFGIILPKGISPLRGRVGGLGARELFVRLFTNLGELGCHIAELERQIRAVHRIDEASQRLEAIPRIGPTQRECTCSQHWRREGVQEW